MSNNNKHSKTTLTSDYENDIVVVNVEEDQEEQESLPDDEDDGQDENIIYDNDNEEQQQQQQRIVMEDVDLLDEATLRILDIRTRLRQRRRKMIKTFTIITIILGICLFVGLAVTGVFEGRQHAIEQKQILHGNNNNNNNNNKTYSTTTTTTTDMDGNNNNNNDDDAGITDLLPSPPDDIDDIFSLENLEENPIVNIPQCQSICEISDCCEVPVGYALSCLKLNAQICHEYAQYCDILHSLPSAGFVPQIDDDQETLPPEQLKIQIDTNCIGIDTQYLLHSPCMDLCENGFCCFDTTATTTTCNVNCQLYFNCADAYQVYTQQQPANSPTFQNEISQACDGYDQNNNNNPNNKDCQDICGPGICCFNHYCTPPLGIDCQDYAACFVLHEKQQGNTYDEDLADQIHDACFTTSIVDIPQQCKTLCEPGSCCFDNTCDETIINCATYAECNALHPKFVVVQSDEVQQACSSSATTSGDNNGLCEQICHLEIMQCCFHRKENYDACLHHPLKFPGSIECNMYESCRALGIDTSENGQLLNSHQLELAQVCNDSTTRTRCIQLCSAAACCYAQNVQDECANVGKTTISCDDYQACDVLYTD